jgi:hypothetical protein
MSTLFGSDYYITTAWNVRGSMSRNCFKRSALEIKSQTPTKNWTSSSDCNDWAIMGIIRFIMLTRRALKQYWTTRNMETEQQDSSASIYTLYEICTPDHIVQQHNYKMIYWYLLSHCTGSMPLIVMHKKSSEVRRLLLSWICRREDW